jgi:hypothetical protein
MIFGCTSLPAEGFQALERSRLVLAHEARVADHVGGEYGGKPAFQALSPSIRRLAASGGEIHASERTLEIRPSTG